MRMIGRMGTIGTMGTIEKIGRIGRTGRMTNQDVLSPKISKTIRFVGVDKGHQWDCPDCIDVT
jgi:xanthine/uracil permease